MRMVIWRELYKKKTGLFTGIFFLFFSFILDDGTDAYNVNEKKKKKIV